MKPTAVALLALMLCAAASAGMAGSWTPGGALYQPQVPLSAFARPASWLDPSRLHVSAELMMGSGSRRGGLDGLQVTRFSYQLGPPLAMRVSLGNAFGAQAAGPGRMFLEGLDLSYRPFTSLLVQFHYQDVRSPLQLSRPGAYDFWR